MVLDLFVELSNDQHIVAIQGEFSLHELSLICLILIWCFFGIDYFVNQIRFRFRLGRAPRATREVDDTESTDSFVYISEVCRCEPYEGIISHEVVDAVVGIVPGWDYVPN